VLEDDRIFDWAVGENFDHQATYAILAFGRGRGDHPRHCLTSTIHSAYPDCVVSARTAVRRLSVARAISVTGSQVATIALTYQVYELTNSAVWVSGVFLATFASYGILAPIGGWLGDSFDRRVIMIVSDVVAASVFLVLVFASEPWMLLVLALFATAAEVPFLPASQAAIPNLAEPEDLAWANGLVSQAYALGIAVGPLIGGVLVGGVGASAAFGINAVSFLVSAFLVWSIHADFQEDRSAISRHEGGRGLTVGIRLVWSSRVLRLVVAAEIIAYSVIGWAMVSDAPLADLFDVGAIGFAALIAAWGIGMLIGSWAMGRWLGQRRIEVKVIMLGMMLGGIMIALMGVSPWFIPILLACIIGGAGSGCTTVARETLLQRSVPDSVRSSVFAVAEVASSVAFTLGLALAGPAIELLGVRLAYVLSGAVFSLGALMLVPVLLNPDLREAAIDDLPST
jgi:MFS family permease